MRVKSSFGGERITRTSARALPAQVADRWLAGAGPLAVDRDRTGGAQQGGRVQCRALAALVEAWEKMRASLGLK